MKRENVNYARTLNRRLKGWDDEGIESNQVKLTRQMLEDFYTKHDLEVGNEDKFATNLDLTPEQEKEYEMIMDQFGDSSGSSVNEMKRVYQEQADMYRDRYDIESFDEFIEFTDNMKNALSDGLIKDVISSEQIAELYTVASNRQMGADAVDKLISETYQRSGRTFDRLYNDVMGAINNYDAEMEQGWM